MPMKVSIVTVCFNSANTIRDAISSVISQSYPNIEYIIVDGGSTDGTLDILRAHSSHLSCWISEPDNGTYDAMNKGIHLASGDVIAILNSDDFYVHSEVIAQVVSHFQRTNADSVYGDLQYVAKDNTEKVVRCWTSGIYQRRNFLYGWMPPHPAFFVRRSVYKSLGCFDTRLRTSADYELMLRFLYRYKISTDYLPELMVRMRTGGASNSSWVKRIEANLEDRQAWKMNGLRPYFFTAILKPLRKVKQFLIFKQIRVSTPQVQKRKNHYV